MEGARGTEREGGRGMDFIGPVLPKEIERYLSQYDGCFERSEQREQFRAYVAGLMSETQHKNIAAMTAKVVEGNYQAAHHFLADAPWRREKVNVQRLQLIQQEPSMGLRAQGWWIQDDTGQERRYWKPESGRYGTDGVARQYIGNVGKVSAGLVFVSTGYADGEKQTSVVAELYWPEAAREKLAPEDRTAQRSRDKIEIALGQARWIEQHVADPKPRRVLMDAWYGSNARYLKTLQDELKWTYVASIRGNVKLFIPLPGEHGHPEHCAREFLRTLLKAEDFEAISVRRADGREQTVWAAELKKVKVKVKKLGYVAHFVVQVDDPHRLNADEADYMLANDAGMTLAEIIRARALRNEVEVFYEDGKDDLGLDQAEVRAEEKLLRHWTLVMLVHTMLETFRRRGDLSGRSKSPLKTRGDVLRLIRDVFRWDFWMVWLREGENLRRFIKWFCASRGLTVSWQSGTIPAS